MSTLREYTVTTRGPQDTGQLWDDLTNDKPSPQFVPDRPVEAADERPYNPRNTSYFLTDEEAELLRQDPRVEDVVALDELRIKRTAFQDYEFNKTTLDSGTKANWGLLRHVNTTNVFANSTSDPGGTYDYVLDGTGVDVVIVDSGIQADHPEFQDAQGNSRVRQIDWFQASGVAGTMPANFYTDYDGHGTQCAGVIAGKTFGWAKNADIYAIKLRGLEGTSDPGVGISVANMFDVILGWHNNKTNGRPTIVNHSWGYVVYWNTNTNELTFDGGPGYPITGGEYRGSAWSGSTKDITKGHTGTNIGGGLYQFPYPVTAVDVDVQLHVNAGIIVCIAAGNDSLKVDAPGGTDYNNYISLTGLGNFFYHRGSSPRIGSNPGFNVGSFGTSFEAITNKDARSTYSNAGPGVTVYAAGDRITTATSTTEAEGLPFNYHLNGSYKQNTVSGTSFAAPQIAGISALVMQAHPDWTPSQLYGWITSNAQNQLFSTGLDNDYTTGGSVFGGGTAIAYLPMNGQKVYQMVAA